MANRRRVAITGIGLVTPVGLDVDTTWRALLDGTSGAAPIARFDASGFPVRIAAEVKGFDIAERIDDHRLSKRMNRSHGFALAAAIEAMDDAGIRPTIDDSTRWGCSVGTGMMGVEYDELAELHRDSADDGELDTGRLPQARVATDPMVFYRSQTTTGLATLTQYFGIRGYSTAVHTACASGGQAIGTALKLIRRGTVDRALAGGFDSMVNPIGLSGFCLLGALSTDNDAPERASRPFDATRNGFVLGEGAGFVVLEEWESARRRGAPIYAELAGEGNSLSSYRVTDSHPSGDGPIQSMQAAIADAGAAVGDVDYVNAHGTSTQMNDSSEAAAIRAVFGNHVGDTAVSSTKGVTGHMIAAAGAVEVIACALAIRNGVLPVNANLQEQGPDCGLDLVAGTPRRRDVGVAISNSFGFGGSNSCVALRNPVLADAEIAANG